MSFLSTLESHLNLVPVIVAAVQAYQAIGNSKESTVQKIGQIIEVSAEVGESVGIPQVTAISNIVADIAESVFAPPATATPPATPAT